MKTINPLIEASGFTHMLALCAGLHGVPKELYLHPAMVRELSDIVEVRPNHKGGTDEFISAWCDLKVNRDSTLYPTLPVTVNQIVITSLEVEKLQKCDCRITTGHETWCTKWEPY